MFKKILTEIHRQKKLMNLMEEEKEIKSVIFGDNIIDYLDKKNFDELPELTGKNLKLKDLISHIKNMDERPEVDHVFFSIGKNDKFENADLIDILSHRLKEKFPNANINVIKPILDVKDYNNLSTDVPPTESNAKKFYDEFKVNRINVLGDYDILNVDMGRKDQKIKSLENDILDKMVLNVSDYDVEEKEENIDILGEDETDFDTIYEFINRFEDIVKSNNVYEKNMSSSFKPDIEQIQIVLKFLDQDNEDLEVTGEIDTPTENAIEDFQRSNNLEVTGYVDNETLDEMLYELKAKGFDELDLAKYMGNLDQVSNVKTSSDIKTTKDLEKKLGAAAAVGAVGAGAAISLTDSGRTSRVAGTRADDDRIYRAILTGIGADDTEENMLFFKAWRTGEGAKASYNPFNTTQNMPGATKYNSVGVRNFKSEADGIAATIKTLKNGYYPCIVDGLKRSIGAKNISKNCLANLKTWGTGDLVFTILNRGGSFTPPPIYRI